MKAPDEICFMADRMLIKVGKYLRILGYDCEWSLSLRTHDVIHRANREERVFLTRNTHLADQYPDVSYVRHILSTDPVVQLRQVMAEEDLDPHTFLFSRCVRCNVVLEPVRSKEQIRAFVHPNVYRRYEQFYTCPSCETVFWKGSHVRNTCRKLEIECPDAARSGALRT